MTAAGPIRLIDAHVEALRREMDELRQDPGKLQLVLDRVGYLRLPLDRAEQVARELGQAPD